MNHKDLSSVVTALSQANRVLFITGAGVSEESGIPTYRGIGGIYNQKLKNGMEVEELLSISSFNTNPHLVWKYIYEMENRCRNALPNRGHYIIAKMEEFLPYVLVVTQNVDGLHRKAGSKNLIELHGYIYNLKCRRCGKETEVSDFSHIDIPPYCSECGGIIRPDVVFFGETLPVKKYYRLISEIKDGFDIVFSVGTSSLFSYVSLPVYEIKNRGGLTVEINPSFTSISHIVDIKITMEAGPALSLIWENYRQRFKIK